MLNPMFNSQRWEGYVTQVTSKLMVEHELIDSNHQSRLSNGRYGSKNKRYETMQYQRIGTVGDTCHLHKTKNGVYIRWGGPFQASGFNIVDVYHVHLCKSKIELSIHVSLDSMDLSCYGVTLIKTLPCMYVSVSEDDVTSSRDVRYVAATLLRQAAEKWTDLESRVDSTVELFDHCSKKGYAASDIIQSYGYDELVDIKTPDLKELTSSLGFRDSNSVRDRMRRAYARGPELIKRDAEDQYV